MSEEKNVQPAQEQELSEILQIRRDKLSALQQEGRDPFQQTRFIRSAWSQEIKENYDAFDGKTVSVTEYEYKNGLCVSENNYEGESFVISEYKYEYDDSDRISRCVRIDHIEGDTTENRYTYTSDGLLLADLSYGTDGKVISRTEYSYDDKGNAVKLSVYNAMGEPMSSTSKEYTYDDLGNIKRCVVTHSDGSKGTTTEYKWEYSKG